MEHILDRIFARVPPMLTMFLIAAPIGAVILLEKAAQSLPLWVWPLFVAAPFAFALMELAVLVGVIALLFSGMIGAGIALGVLGWFVLIGIVGAVTRSGI